MKAAPEILICAVAVLGLTAAVQEEICEHRGEGPTTPLRGEQARAALAGLDAAPGPPEDARPPRPVRLPACPRRDVRRRELPWLPPGLAGRSFRVETSEGVDPGFLQDLGIRCVPTEVRILAGGVVELVEK